MKKEIFISKRGDQRKKRSKKRGRKQKIMQSKGGKRGSVVVLAAAVDQKEL